MRKNSKNFQDWLLKAEHDLKAAEGIVGYYEEPPTDMVCYHCHQVAEKALKAFLVSRGKELPRIHDLVALLSLCIEEESSLEMMRNELRVLNKYFIETRYPPDMPIEYPRDEAVGALHLAGVVLKIVNEKIE